jgi:peptide/nickel transport system substrate-binding protein
VINFYADSPGLALAITAGDVDVAFRQLATNDITTMEGNTNLKVWKGTGAFIQYLCLQEKYAPFDNPVVRGAVAAAINRTTLVQTVFQGQAQELYSMIPVGMFGHTDAFTTYGNPNYTLTRELCLCLDTMKITSCRSSYGMKPLGTIRKAHSRQ